MGIAASVLIALGTTTLAQATEIKTDNRIEVSAATRAAIRVGGIRGTISFDEQPVVTIHEVSEGETGPASKPNVDPFPTGSIAIPNAVPEPKIEWDVFDKYGRPVKR